MRLVVDANVIISALLRKGATRAILCKRDTEFILPQFVLEEVYRHKALILKKSGLSGKSFTLLLSLIVEDMTIMPSDSIEQYLHEAKQIMKDVDVDDAPILATALVDANDGIWTDDKHFLQQKRVNVWRTGDLVDYFR